MLVRFTISIKGALIGEPNYGLITNPDDSSGL
jgi:hypothetical protein